MKLSQIRKLIVDDPMNKAFTKKGWEPVYTAHQSAKILIIGQAPGRRAQESGIPWNDPSGDNLRAWMGLTRDEFYDAGSVALVPMDFYFPGSAARGDAPPRPGFAEAWHPRILAEMPHITLTLLVGQYSQAHYLGDRRKETLTKTVRAYKEYLPQYLPLVHPSPRNNIWQSQNPWFAREVLPELRRLVRRAL